jgi:uncharacterized protein with FMN-binding domain
VRRAILASFGTIVGLILLLGFKTHSTTAPAPASALTPGSGGSLGTSSGSSAAGSAGSSGASSPGTKTVTGQAVDTQYGPVQVRITVANGKITAAQAIEYPQNQARDQEINSWAIPQLNKEAINASSANIDALSGATYTSEGYIQSLQSALDQAR